MNFKEDLFALRRSGGENSYGNPYDPESLLTEAESREGLSYDNSHREFSAPHLYNAATSGKLTTTEVLIFAPRVPNV